VIEVSAKQEVIMDLPVMADPRMDAIINAPSESIDLTAWVFGLTDEDYQACSKDHIAAAASFTDDGKRMSINVERIGSLIVQHYIEDIAECRHCRLISLSDTFGPDITSRGQVNVMWEFFVEAIDAAKTKFTNHVEVKAVSGFEDALRRQGVTLEQAQHRAQSVLAPHNTEETHLFAKDIERKALAGRWR
jgi:hypothetical protein